MTKRVALLISGRGSNMRVILEKNISADIQFLVIANRADSAGLVYVHDLVHNASETGIQTALIPSADFTQGVDFDRALQQRLDQFAPDFVLLAGFMRILGSEFVNAFIGRLINIHPSLLPAFPGLHTHQRALDARVLEHGASVHWVTTGVDEGEVIIQAPVPVIPTDTESDLAARVLAQEHIIYPAVLSWLVSGALRWDSGRMHYDDSVLLWCQNYGYRTPHA